MSTQTIKATDEWKNVVTELSLDDGTKYILQSGGDDVLRSLSAAEPTSLSDSFRMQSQEVWPFTASSSVPLWIKKRNFDTIVSVEETP